jgi:hypothetical protein
MSRTTEVYIFRREHERSIETYMTTYDLAGVEFAGQHKTPDEPGFVLVAHVIGRDEHDAARDAKSRLCGDCKLPRKPIPPPPGYAAAMCSCAKCEGCAETVPGNDVIEGYCSGCRS